MNASLRQSMLCALCRLPMHFFSSLIFSDLNLPSLVLTYLTRSFRIYLDLLAVVIPPRGRARIKKRAPVRSRALFRVRRWVPPVINTKAYTTREQRGCRLVCSRSIQHRSLW